MSLLSCECEEAVDTEGEALADGPTLLLLQNAGAKYCKTEREFAVRLSQVKQ